MNTTKVCRFAALLLTGALATGCSLLKFSVTTDDPLPREAVNTRTLTRGFYYDLASEVSRTADSIAAAAPDVRTRIAAIRWKIRATRAGVTAVMQGIPDVALADVWILCRRMDDAFAAAPDSLLFGPWSPLARATTARLDRRADSLARDVLDAERYRLMSAFVAEYVAAHPAEEAEATNTTLAWVEYLRARGIEQSFASGSISEVIADVNDRVSGQTQQLASSVGWSKDILEMQLQQDSIRTQIGRQLDSLDRNFNRIVLVAGHLPEISDHMLAELNGQVSDLIATVNSSVDNAFAGVDRQREELQHYVTREREALVDQLRTSADELVQRTFDALPALVGKVVFYLVAGLLVLLGVPFALGFWLGVLREKARERKRAKEPR